MEHVIDVNETEASALANHSYYLAESGVTYLVGEHNRLAWLTIKNIRQLPTSSSGLLYINGLPGSGKTRLLQECAIHWAATMPASKVCFRSAGTLLADVIGSIRRGDLESLRSEWSVLSLLLIDDFNLLEGKTQTLTVLGEIFKSITDNGGTVILVGTSFCYQRPTTYDSMSGFMANVPVIQLSMPDDETKIAYCKSINQTQQMALDENLLMVIAMKLCQSFKDIDLAIAKLQA